MDDASGMSRKPEHPPCACAARLSLPSTAIRLLCHLDILTHPRIYLQASSGTMSLWRAFWTPPVFLCRKPDQPAYLRRVVHAAGAVRVRYDARFPPTCTEKQGVWTMATNGANNGHGGRTAETERIPLTSEGYEENQARLTYLVTERRQQVADYIHEAKEAGDISESSAYEDAKNLQAMRSEEQTSELQSHVNL